MIEQRKPFILTAEEKHSALWKKLMRYWDERLETLHAQNEGDHDAAKTANIRGKMSEIRLNQSLNKDKPTE